MLATTKVGRRCMPRLLVALSTLHGMFSLCGVLSVYLWYAGSSGLAVACLTAVREVLGSNRAVDVVFIAQPLRFTALGTGCVHLSCSA